MLRRDMKAIEVTNPGSTSQLRLVDMPMPTPKKGEILIRVEYAGVNRADIFQRQGNYAPPKDASPLLGLEISGTVATLGEGVSQWNEGDKVCALLEGGGYAEYCTAPTGLVLLLPEGYGFKEAAALPEALATVWLTLIKEAKLQSGERFLVHGGASGIGTMAIQIAKWRGADVYATASTQVKCALCERLGATKALNYKTQDFVSALGDFIAPHKLDVILDMTGGDNIQKNLSLLGMGGRMVSIALLRGAKVEVNAAHLLLKRLHWMGSTLRSRSIEEKSLLINEIRDNLWPVLAEGDIKPILDSEFPLNEAEKAHLRMEQNLNLGKIVLRIGSLDQEP